MTRERKAVIVVDREDWRIAKGIASFKGVTIAEYFKNIVDNEAQAFQKEMKSEYPIYRRKR